MGKITRECPMGRYRLKADSKTDKPFPVYLEYSFNGNIRRKQIGIKAKKADWNPRGNNGRGELNASYGSDYKVINARLKQKVDETDIKLSKFNDEHPRCMNLSVIEAFLNGKPITRQDNGEDFKGYVEKRLDAKYNIGKIGVSRRANGYSCMKQFQEFLLVNHLGTYKEDSIYLGDLKPETIEKFIKWKKDIKKNKAVSINQNLAPIICALEDASDEGLIPQKVYTKIKNMKLRERNSIDDSDKSFDGKFLSKAEMAKIVAFHDNDTEQRRKEYIEMFLFAFYACGLRVSDVMTLKWRQIDFEHKKIVKVLVKTKNRKEIPLTDKAIEILQKWKSMHRNDRFVFDLVDNNIDLNNSDELYKVRNTVTKCINQSLKVVGEKLELHCPLTMHKARHTFACLALNDGMSMSVVSRLLGHESTDTTERIYAMYSKDTLADEITKLKFDF